MKLKNRRGISTFIATLLLMVLAVAAGVVIYAYTMGYLGGFGGPQTMGAISVDTWSLNTTKAEGEVAVTAYLRNIGKTSFVMDAVYINGIKIKANDTAGVFGWRMNPTKIDETMVGVLEIQQSSEKDTTTWDVVKFLPSTTYEIKLVGQDNTQISFTVKK